MNEQGGSYTNTVSTRRANGRLPAAFAVIAELPLMAGYNAIRIVWIVMPSGIRSRWPLCCSLEITAGCRLAPSR